MDWLGPSTDFVKFVGGRFVRYLKYQIKYNDLLQEFEQRKQGLRNRKHDIEAELKTQLESAPYNDVKREVGDWLREVEEFIERQNVVDEVNSWRCLSCCCRAVILEERRQELKEICDRGDKCTMDRLVIEDHSRKLNYYLRNFYKWKEKLRCERRDVDSLLRSQQGNGKIEREKVKCWREKVEQMLNGVREIEDEIEDEIGGRLSPSSDSQVMLLEEKIEEMKRMCEEGSQLPDCLVIDDPSASVVELLTQELQGNEAVKANILTCLKGDGVTMLGVWGMGGAGKTTIMKHVHNELLKEGKFKKIIWVDVSESFVIRKLQEQIVSENYVRIIRKLQEQIVCSLKEKLEELQNATNRAGVLSKLLEKQKPYLLILDDVWSSFKLEDVGIPKPNVINGCKIVLTTRSQEVARSMDCKRIQVKTLSEYEALNLFLNNVGDAALSCPGGGIKGTLESTLKDIVDECDGLPLALITVAGSLKGISNSRLWSVALDQLRNCKRNVAGIDDDNAFQILKFSYDRLTNPRIQYCFLYCALYPEDYKIRKEEIIENWIDEGFIDEMESRQSMKDEGYAILRKLEDNSLLEFIKDEHKGDYVRMHNVIRDMALHITRTSPRFLVEAGKSLREIPERVNCAEGVEKVSLMFNQIEDIPLRMASSTCIRLTTLLLGHNDLSTIPEFIFEHMSELKILDLSFNPWLSSLPNSISKLVKLTALLLEETSLEEVPFLSSLGSLIKLNLKGTKIKGVPKGLGMLKNLKCLFLCGLRYDNLQTDEIADGVFSEMDEIANGVLSNLSKLEELIVARSRIKLKGDVVGSLKKLKIFHGWFPTVNEMIIFFKCQPSNLSDYFINVGSKWSRIYCVREEFPRYKKIMVFKDTTVVGENVLFPSVQVLCLNACRDIKCLNDISAIKDATNLRRCQIWECYGMEYVFSSWINNSVVETLESLELYWLDRLDGLLFEANIMVTSSSPPRVFSSLQKVVILNCRKIKKLFPSWKLVQNLQNLEVIDVEDCDEMEEIIGSDPEEGGDIIKLILPKLKHLRLLNMRALKSICSRRAVMVCNSLGFVTIINCKGLWRCEKIKKLFPSWKSVDNLRSLERIDVRSCTEIEEIIGSDPEEEGEGEGFIKKLFLPKLKQLRLENLLALKSICSKRAVMVCDSLESITIKDCKGLRRIPLYLPSVNNVELSRPPSLQEINASEEFWESLEWDHPNALDVLQPLFKAINS